MHTSPLPSLPLLPLFPFFLSPFLSCSLSFSFHNYFHLFLPFSLSSPFRLYSLISCLSCYFFSRCNSNTNVSPFSSLSITLSSSFCSPPSTCLYPSLILRPSLFSSSHIPPLATTLLPSTSLSLLPSLKSGFCIPSRQTHRNSASTSPILK